MTKPMSSPCNIELFLPVTRAATETGPEIAAMIVLFSNELAVAGIMDPSEPQ